jgi:hypothetical protein
MGRLEIFLEDEEPGDLALGSPRGREVEAFLPVDDDVDVDVDVEDEQEDEAAINLANAGFTAPQTSQASKGPGFINVQAVQAQSSSSLNRTNESFEGSTAEAFNVVESWVELSVKLLFSFFFVFLDNEFLLGRLFFLSSPVVRESLLIFFFFFCI